MTSLGNVILGDPGADSGGEEKSKRARKKFGRRKSKTVKFQAFNVLRSFSVFNNTMKPILSGHQRQ